MVTKKLSQILAVELEMKSSVYAEVTQLSKTLQKPDLFNGLQRTYKKKDEQGEDLPPERKVVQQNVYDILDRVVQLNSAYFDVVVTKDMANCSAKADLVTDGNALAKDLPATYLLFLDKQLTDMRKFIDLIPTLDEAEVWDLDQNSNLYKSGTSSTQRTKKAQRGIVLYEATEKHPAQTQLITDDIAICCIVLRFQWQVDACPHRKQNRSS